MSSRSGYGSRPVRTCTECKQVKLRCDSKARFPEPCTRCRSRNLICTVDPSFRRTPTRKRLEAMSRELQELRYQRNSRLVSTCTTGTESSNSQHSSPDLEYSPAEFQVDDFELTVESVTLGSVSISAAQVGQILKKFKEFFHPHLPILGRISANDLHQNSPFLFWTLVTIVANRINDGPCRDIFCRLEEPYVELFRTEILKAPLPIHKIQAVLHVCMWPLPVKRQGEDPSWLYSGIALSSAIFLGLNRPKAPTSLRCIGVVSGTAQERTNTWLGCFHVCTCLSIHFGLPPLITSDADLHTTRSLATHDFIGPIDFIIQLRVDHIVAILSRILTQTSGDAPNFSVVKLLEGELDSLKADYSGQWRDACTLGMLVAKLHVYTLVITKTQVGSTPRNILLKCGLDVALGIVKLTTSLSRDMPCTETQEVLTPAQQKRTLPKTHFRGLAFAAVFLLRYFSLNCAADPEEQQLASNAIVTVHSYFRSCSTDPTDEFARTANLIDTLGRQSPTLVDETNLRLTNRMGVSILLDAISAAQEIRRKAVEVGQLDAPVEDFGTQEYGSFEQSIQPGDIWSTDFAFSNQFWNDPMWNFFSLEPGPSQ